MGASSRLWVFAATPPLLLYAALNWDLLALCFAVLGLLLYRRQRDGWAALFLTLGLWTKIFPGILLLWIAARRGAQGRWRALALVAAVVAGASLALNLPFYLPSPSGWLYFLDFQRSRPPDGGSIWSYFPEWSITSVNLASLVLSTWGAVVLAMARLRTGRRAEEFAAGSLALLVLASKVTSPQYDLWLMPFLALSAAPVWLVATFAGIDLAYFWASFQILYTRWGGQSSLGELHPVAVAAVNAARQLALVAICLWIVQRMVRGRRKPRGEPATAGEPRQGTKAQEGKL